MSKDTQNQIKKIVAALALSWVALCCIGCGSGDLSIEEGPALKDVLNAKEAELNAIKNANQLVSQLGQCGPDRVDLNEIKKSNPVTVDGKPADELSATKINAFEAIVLAGKSTHKPLIIRAKCFFVSQNQTLSTDGRPAIYVIADYVKIEGRLETTPLTTDPETLGQIHIAALSLEVGPQAYFDTGDFSDAEIQRQIRRQVVMGGVMLPLSHSELLENGVQDSEILGETSRGTLVRRLPRADAPFSVSDAKHIFEAAQVIGVDSESFKAEDISNAWPGYFESLVFDSDRAKFHAAARSRKFWSFIESAGNHSNWTAALNQWTEKFNSVDLPKRYQTNLAAQNAQLVPPVFIEEEYRGENPKEVHQLRLSAPGKIELVSTLGTPPSEIIKHYRNYSNVVSEMMTTKLKVNRFVEVNITVHRSIASDHLLTSAHEIHELLLVPAPVSAQSVTLSAPDVVQDLATYNMAFNRWNIAPGRRLNGDEADIVQKAASIRK